MNKTSVIQIRVTPEQKAAIKARADKNGKKVSVFLLDLALQGADLTIVNVSSREEAAEIIGAPIDKNFTDELKVITEDPDRHLPTSVEVDALALKIHNEEGESMRAAMAIALARLSASEPST